MLTAGTSKMQRSNSSSTQKPLQQMTSSTSQMANMKGGVAHTNNSDDDDEEDGDDAAVALQYIVHDNGELEMVQRVMPYASFSDRRSVDTPVPNHDEPAMSPHPDAMECASAAHPSTQKLPTQSQDEVPQTLHKDNMQNHGDKDCQSTSHPSLQPHSLPIHPAPELSQEHGQDQDIHKQHGQQPTAPPPNSYIEYGHNDMECQTINRDTLQLTQVPSQLANMRIINKGPEIIHLSPAPSITTAAQPQATRTSTAINVSQQQQQHLLQTVPGTSNAIQNMLSIDQKHLTPVIPPLANSSYTIPSLNQQQLQSTTRIELILADNQRMVLAQPPAPPPKTSTSKVISLHDSTRNSLQTINRGQQILLTNTPQQLAVQQLGIQASPQNPNGFISVPRGNMELSSLHQQQQPLMEASQKIQGNLVTVNASHIAPMTSSNTGVLHHQHVAATKSNISHQQHQHQSNWNVNICAGQQIPNNQSHVPQQQQPPQQQQVQLHHHHHHQQQQTNAQTQSEKEEELAEWLNDAYKRKR